MRGKVIAFVMMVVATSVAARAQEPAVDEQDQAQEQEAARRPLRVLDNPYDISSFYRSSQGGGGFYGPVDLLRQPLDALRRPLPDRGFLSVEPGLLLRPPVPGLAEPVRDRELLPQQREQRRALLARWLRPGGGRGPSGWIQPVLELDRRERRSVPDGADHPRSGGRSFGDLLLRTLNRSRSKGVLTDSTPFFRLDPQESAGSIPRA